ncbi:unnamed protein product, partial [Ascophyllum nodosum]
VTLSSAPSLVVACIPLPRVRLLSVIAAIHAATASASTATTSRARGEDFRLFAGEMVEWEQSPRTTPLRYLRPWPLRRTTTCRNRSLRVREVSSRRHWLLSRKTSSKSRGIQALEESGRRRRPVGPRPGTSKHESWTEHR